MRKARQTMWVRLLRLPGAGSFRWGETVRPIFAWSPTYRDLFCITG
jgi:hypothetical protein